MPEVFGRQELDVCGNTGLVTEERTKLLVIEDFANLAFESLNAQVSLLSRIFRVTGQTIPLPGRRQFMKIKLVLASLAVAGLAVSSAVAAPPEGKGKPRTGEGCKPKIAVVLKGTLVSASMTSLSMNVTGANRWGRAWKNAGTASVALDDQDEGSRRRHEDGRRPRAKLKAGDRVLVQARVCKDELKDPNDEACAYGYEGHRPSGEGRERRRGRRLEQFPWEGTAAACD